MRIKDEFCHEIIINKSRFITYLKRIENEKEARDYLLTIKKLHPKANHHCFAMLVDDNNTRSSDDNEPAGTAGIPMLEVLKKNQMELICAITVRYFGGIKLGAGGLIRAYSSSVSEALEKVDKYETQLLKIYSLKCDYHTFNKIEKLLINTTIIKKEYQENVYLEFAVLPDYDFSNINEVLKGQYPIEYLNDQIIEIKKS